MKGPSKPKLLDGRGAEEQLEAALEANFLLQKKVLEAQQDVTRAKASCKKLQRHLAAEHDTKLTDLQSKLKAAEARLKQSEQDRHRSKSLELKAREERKEWSQKITKLQQENAVLKLATLQQEKQLAEKEQAMSQMSQKLSSAENATLQEENAALQQQLARKEQAMSQMSQKLSVAEQESIQIQEKLRADCEERMADFQKNCEEKLELSQKECDSIERESEAKLHDLELQCTQRVAEAKQQCQESATEELAAVKKQSAEELAVWEQQRQQAVETAQKDAASNLAAANQLWEQKLESAKQASEAQCAEKLAACEEKWQHALEAMQQQSAADLATARKEFEQKLLAAQKTCDEATVKHAAAVGRFEESEQEWAHKLALAQRQCKPELADVKSAAVQQLAAAQQQLEGVAGDVTYTAPLPFPEEQAATHNFSAPTGAGCSRAAANQTEIPDVLVKEEPAAAEGSGAPVLEKSCPADCRPLSTVSVAKKRREAGPVQVAVACKRQRSACGAAAPAPIPRATELPRAADDKARRARECEGISQLAAALSEAGSGSVVNLRGRQLWSATGSSPGGARWASTQLLPQQGKDGRFNLIGAGQHGHRLCTVSAAVGTELRSGKLLTHNCVLILDESCKGLALKGLEFRGGVLACHGKGCNITLSDVKFNGCTLVVTAGATVSLTSCSFTRDKGGVSVVVSGQGTTVFMRDVTLRGGELGVAVLQEGSLKASELHLKGVTSGVDVSDKLSTVELDDCVFGDISSGSLQESIAPDTTACVHKGEGVAVRNSSTAILKNVAISNVHRGVMVASDATATLSGCTVGRSDRCVWVSTHGTCDLQDCTLAGALIGVSVHGASSVEARGCRIQRHMTAGVKVVKDGRFVGKECHSACDSSSVDNTAFLATSGTVDIAGCTITGHTRSCWCTSGAKLLARTVTARAFRSVGFHIQSASHATLEQCEVRMESNGGDAGSEEEGQVGDAEFEEGELCPGSEPDKPPLPPPAKSARQVCGMVLNGACSVGEMRGCKVFGGAVGVAVKNAATMCLDTCQMAGASRSGLEVCGAGSSAVVSACSFLRIRGTGLSAKDGAQVCVDHGESSFNYVGYAADGKSQLKLQDCSSSYNTYGSDVCGATLTAQGMHVKECRWAGFFMQGGAACDVKKCTVADCLGCGIRVQDSGTNVTVGGCSVSGSRAVGIQYDAGTRGRVFDSSVVDSQLQGIAISEHGTMVDVVDCRLQGNHKGAVQNASLLTTATPSPCAAQKVGHSSAKQPAKPTAKPTPHPAQQLGHSSSKQIVKPKAKPISFPAPKPSPSPAQKPGHSSAKPTAKPISYTAAKSSPLPAQQPGHSSVKPTAKPISYTAAKPSPLPAQQPGHSSAKPPSSIPPLEFRSSVEKLADAIVEVLTVYGHPMELSKLGQQVQRPEGAHDLKLSTAVDLSRKLKRIVGAPCSVGLAHWHV